MRATVLSVIALLALPGSLYAEAGRSATTLRIDASDRKALEEGLLSLAHSHLPRGFYFDRRHAWMSLSSSMPRTDSLEVRPTWAVDAGVPPLPLTFELWPRSSDESKQLSPIQATLAVPLLREVLIGARRLRKGSVITCADLDTKPREIDSLPKQPLTLPCEIGAQMVTLRDIAAGDVIRAADVGAAPDVTAGAPVRLHVATHGIRVAVTAIALADARIGDQIDVRLSYPTRTFRTRVTGPASVELLDASL